MAFETGTSTSPSDLLAIIEARAAADGWTVIRNNGQGDAGSSDQLSITDPAASETAQFNFIAFEAATGASDSEARVEVKPSTGDGGAGVTLDNQPGAPSGGRTKMGQSGSLFGFEGASERYLLFTGQTGGGRYIHLVVEGAVGFFWHLAFGTIEKGGTVTGGQYTTASFAHNASVGQEPGSILFQPRSSVIETDFGSVHWIRADNFFGFGSPGWQKASGLVSDNALSGRTPLKSLFAGGPDPVTQRTPFAPVFVPFYDSDDGQPSQDIYVLLGHVSDVMQCSLEDREPGATVTLGSDTWHLFPAYSKQDGRSRSTAFELNPGSGSPPSDSGSMGIAYREVP